MAKFKVKITWEERFRTDVNIEAESEEQAREYALEMVQEEGYPETDDVETTNLEFEAERVNE